MIFEKGKVVEASKMKQQVYREVGWILYPADKEEHFLRLLHFCWRDPYIHKNPKAIVIGHSSTIKGRIVYQIYAESFKSWQDFDCFLLKFAEMTYKDREILVIGGNSESGYLWMDYTKDGIPIHEIIEQFSRKKAEAD